MKSIVDQMWTDKAIAEWKAAQSFLDTYGVEEDACRAIYEAMGHSDTSEHLVYLVHELIKEQRKRFYDANKPHKCNVIFCERIVEFTDEWFCYEHTSNKGVTGK